jgi:uncharacterized protein
MVVQELSAEECRAFLTRARIGRLGCSFNDQPYVIPIGIAYEGDFIYVFATVGQKIIWMRENPKVCILVDEIKSESHWESVIVNGLYQELGEHAVERAHARDLLRKQERWWLDALGERHLRASKELLIEPLFFRVRVDSISGLRALDK